MTLFQSILLGGTILFGVVLVIVPESRVLIKGFINLFIQNKAKTPEGAEIVYTEAIDLQQQKYNQAISLYQQLAGKEATLKKTLKSLAEDIDTAEKKCMVFVKANNEDQAKMYAEIRTDKVTEYQLYDKQLQQLSERVEEAKEVAAHCEKQLRELKKRKDLDVAQLKLDSQLANTYDALDELKKTSATDKLLGVVRDGVEEQHERAVGAKLVHENKTSTKLEHADREFKNLAADAYLESLKRQHSTLPTISLKGEKIQTK